MNIYQVAIIAALTISCNAGGASTDSLDLEELVFGNSGNTGGFDLSGYCVNPPVIDNGYLPQQQATYGPNQRLTYRCNDNYQFTGSYRLTCRRGRWVGTRPSCYLPVDPCSVVKCGGGQQCRVVGGVGKCIYNDPCIAKQCPAGNDCKVILGIAHCVLTCKANEQPTNCFPKCEATCATHGQILPCTLECETGSFCTCKQGYVRRGGRDGPCVRPHQCPNPCAFTTCLVGTRCEVENGKAVCKPTCGQNEQYSACEPCDQSCSNRGNPLACPAICRQGHFCACKPGYYRRGGAGSPCVPENECPNPCAAMLCPQGTRCEVENGQGVCKPFCMENEVPNDCASACQGSCDTIGQTGPVICTLNCDERPCVCAPGYIRRSKTDITCIKISQCPVCHDNHCPAYSVCDPIDQESYNCNCNKGYTKKRGKCYKIQCPHPMPLLNGGFTGQKDEYYYMDEIAYYCDAGFELIGVATRTCSANNKFLPEGEIKCKDIDECALGTHDCHMYADCYNTEGGYLCVCRDGYVGDGKNCNKITCSAPESVPYATYVPMDGPYNFGDSVTYNCNAGYKLKYQYDTATCQMNGNFVAEGNIVCEDIDECATYQHKCHQHAKCINTPGSYKCVCKRGYRGNGIICNPIACPPPSPVHHATYSPIKKTYNYMDEVTYKCRTGYKFLYQHKTAECTINGVFVPSGKIKCVDINECATYQANCHEHATCLNTPGSYSCKCKPGYTGDGYNCQPLGCKHPAAGLYYQFGTPQTFYPIGHKLYATCSQHYNMQGVGFLTCVRKGAYSVWEGSITCTPESCAGKCGSYRRKGCSCAPNCKFNCCPDYRAVCSGWY